MSNEVLAQYRQELLAGVSGEVLEIGFGTGLNLPYYPATVQRITTVDPNPGMKKLTQRRIERLRSAYPYGSPIVVDHRVLSGESLPMADDSFDSIDSTWTLCSIPQVEQAIAEIYRLLKPGGKFFFIEHGLSSETKIGVWQNRLTPVQKIIADGCHLNRNIKQIVEVKFDQIKIEQFYSPKLPKILGYMYKGVAYK